MSVQGAPTPGDAVEEWLGQPTFRIGQIMGERRDGAWALCHRDDAGAEALEIFTDPEHASELARFDDAGVYRPLKTAPNLRHGWALQLRDEQAVRLALEHFYPGRLAIYEAWCASRLTATPLRATLARQTGMYRAAAKLGEEEADRLVANFCRSDGGCLRTILWPRDEAGTVASCALPPSKFDPAYDQTGRGEAALPLLCQEACNLLVAEARKVVKGER